MFWWRGRGQVSVYLYVIKYLVRGPQGVVEKTGCVFVAENLHEWAGCGWGERMNVQFDEKAFGVWFECSS